MFYHESIFEKQLKELHYNMLSQKIKFDEIVSKLSETMHPIEKQSKEVVEQMTNIEQRVNTFITLMLSLGWPPPLDLDLRQIELILKAYEESKGDDIINYINEFLVNYYDEKILTEKLTLWKKKIG
jgi:hypothetical protein